MFIFCIYNNCNTGKETLYFNLFIALLQYYIYYYYFIVHVPAYNNIIMVKHFLYSNSIAIYNIIIYIIYIYSIIGHDKCSLSSAIYITVIQSICIMLNYI